MRYRKKPVVINAWPISELLQFRNQMPEEVRKAHEAGLIIFDEVSLSVKTLEGVMVGWPRDMLIQGVRGEFYPCKPDIFATTYEEAP